MSIQCETELQQGEIAVWVYRQRMAVEKEKAAPRRRDGFGSGSITIYLPAAGWRFETPRWEIVLLVGIKIIADFDFW